MAESTVARRYAGALIELGQEHDALDRYAADLSRFASVLEQGDGELMQALSHPALALNERRAVLAAVLPKLGLAPMVANFLNLLLEKGRFRALPAITAEFQTQSDALSGRVRAVVTTARETDAATRDEIKAALQASSGKTVVVESMVDPGLIGGLVVQVGDTIYDASVRTRLQTLQQQLLTQSTVIPGEA